MEYFKQEELTKAQKQWKTVLAFYIIIAVMYLIVCVGCLLWYFTLPYQSKTITSVKVILYITSGVFVVFSFVYMGIPFKRINRYKKMMKHLTIGLKETFEAEFLRFDNTEQEKDGVDMKSLIFSEWNKYKQNFYERKVLVPLEKPFPELKEHQHVKFVTQGNVLISYEIIE